MGGWQLYIRHAHRDTSDRSDDNGLTEKGRDQCRALVRELGRRKPEVRRPTRVLSSPKVRCRETAEFVAEWLGIEVEVDPRLDEQKPRESEKAFLARIRAFWEAERGNSGLCFVTHGDVLPVIGSLGGLGAVDVPKAGYFWLELGD